MITCFLKGERRGREKQWKRREVRESWIGEVENDGRAGRALRRDFICLLEIYIKIQEKEKNNIVSNTCVSSCVWKPMFIAEVERPLQFEGHSTSKERWKPRRPFY